MASTLLPTVRAVALIAAAAPLSLVIAAVAPAAWVVAPALGGVLLVLVAIDALTAGRAPEVVVKVRGDADVGGTLPLKVEAAFARGRPSTVAVSFAADQRLAPAGRIGGPLHQETHDHWHATLPITPDRRGPGQLERLWLRWTGPLGLGARQLSQPLNRTIRVWPSLEVARSPALQTYLRDPNTGLISRQVRGEGHEFEALREFHPGMDRRRIDWKASARHSHLYAKETEAERNNQIVFALDCCQAMCEPIDGVARLDRAVSAALATAYVALKSGDKAALFGFSRKVDLSTPFVTQPRDFHRLRQAAAELDYAPHEPNFTLAMATLASRLQRRSLIVVFSDFTDATSAQLMIESVGRLVSRHLVLFVTMADAELDGFAREEPGDLATLTRAVTADALLRQRRLVVGHLRRIGVDVIEAPYDKIGLRLIDAYLAIKRAGVIG